MLSCENKSRSRYQFWHFSISEKAQLPAIGITKQPVLLTKSKINRPGYKCSKCFRLNREVKSCTRSRPRPRI